MTREDAIKELQSYAEHSWGDLNDVFDMAISALRQQDVPDKDVGKNEPLTLDELRKMDGEPVWVQFLHNKIGYWYLIDCHNSEFIRFYRSGFFINGEYSKGFLAYRRKPEEG